MKYSKSQSWRGLTLAVLVGTWLSGGCGLSSRQKFSWLYDRAATQDDAPATAAPDKEHPDHDSSLEESGPARATETKLSDELVASLGGQSWFLTTARADQPAPAHRWRHVGVEEALARGVEIQPALIDLAQTTGPAAVAAAVALVRMENHAGMNGLSSAVENYRLPLAARRAAVEALGEVASDAAGASLRELCQRFETAAQEASAVYASELHADLVGWLAQHATPADETRLRTALRSPAAEVRRAAVAAWGQATVGPLPVEAFDLRSDPAPTVRIQALDVIVERRPNEAFDILTAALSDQDILVREAAALGLGRLGEAAACARLKPLLDDSSERLRAAALTALAQLGDDEAVLAAADNTSWLARGAAADALAEKVTPEAATVLARLAADASGHVRQHAVQTLGQWPLEQAGPLLLDALDHASYQTRKQAAAELARRWAPAREFSVDAPAERREALLSALRQKWQAQYGRVQRAALTAAAVATRPGLDERASAELLSQLRQPPADARGLVERLGALSPHQWRSLEAAASASGHAVSESAYRTLLPQVHAVYLELENLRTGDLTIQRSASRKLAQARRDERLPLWALERMLLLLQSQTDEQVWRGALEAAADDGRPAAVQLAALALVQPSADIRRRGCEALARFGDDSHVSALSAALVDPQASVAVAAAKALGRPGLLRDPAPLIGALDGSDQQLRLTAARSLVRGGFPQGPAALERLCHESDAKTRVQAAQAMGELADERFVPALLKLADDPVADVRLAALANLPRVTGHDLTSGAEARGSLSPHERLHLWKRWWAQQQESAAQRAAAQ